MSPCILIIQPNKSDETHKFSFSASSGNYYEKPERNQKNLLSKEICKNHVSTVRKANGWVMRLG